MNASLLRLRAGLGALLLALPAMGSAQTRPELDVPFVPTTPEVVREMLTLAQVGPNDLVYDLGSGDGRIVIAAAQDFGARGVGVDLDPERVAEAEANAKEARVADKVRFVQGDLFEADFSDATVLTMYLLTDVNLRLRPKILEELRPGTRVVSHDFDMGDWKPDQTSTASGRQVYLWIVPAPVHGAWEWSVGEGDQAQRYRVDLSQQFQQVNGRASINGQPAQLTDARLRGDELRLTIRTPGAAPQEFVARYRDGQLVGSSAGGEQMAAQRADWVAERVSDTPST